MVSRRKRFASNSPPTESLSRFTSLSVVLIPVLLSCCDAPARQGGPGDEWDISSSPADGEPGVSRAGPVYVQLDRRVLPQAVSSDSVKLFSGEVRASVKLFYEPVSRRIVAELSGKTPLYPAVIYELDVKDLIDLDGNRQTEPYQAVFRTAVSEPEAVPVLPRYGWPEVEPIFSSRCAGSGCHGGNAPALDLDLSSAAGVERTAAGAPSRQLSFAALPPEGARGALSLAGLSIIDVQAGYGQPAGSYLIYKVLGDPHILGDGMPPPGAGVSGLTKTELKTVSYWIRSGAPVE
jgi:hypothetical protein